MNENEYMKMAIDLAKKGEGRVNPNPLVGALIVKNNRIIGKGYHKAFGQPHAEREALGSITEDAADGTMYVTLEPCCHYGKTPPCTEAIIKSGITKVIIGTLDPNPIVRGKGRDILRDAGIKVEESSMEKECRDLNKFFNKYITIKLPFVTLKYAMTLDGKIATKSGKSKWITGEAARKEVHKERNRHMAIMVGSGTVKKDDPMLNCRIENGISPIRVICDSKLTMDTNNQISRSAKEIRTIIGTCNKDIKKQSEYTRLGIEIIETSQDEGKVNLKELMMKLGEKGIDSVLLEGGGSLNWEAFNKGIIEEVHTYIAPKIFGGLNGKTPVGGQGMDEPNDGFKLNIIDITKYDEDILIKSEVIKKCLQE